MRSIRTAFRRWWGIGSNFGDDGCCGALWFPPYRPWTQIGICRPVLPVGLTLTLKPVLTFVGVWFLINIITGLYSTGGADLSSIAWEAHIGGFIAGFFGISLMDRPRSYDAVLRR